MLSKAASSTIFWVFGMTPSRIEPRSDGKKVCIRKKERKKNKRKIDISKAIELEGVLKGLEVGKERNKERKNERKKKNTSIRGRWGK